MMLIEKDDAIFERVYEYFSVNDNFVKYGDLVDYVSHFFSKDEVIEWIESCPYIFPMKHQVDEFEYNTTLTSEWIM